MTFGGRKNQSIFRASRSRSWPNLVHMHRSRGEILAAIGPSGQNKCPRYAPWIGSFVLPQPDDFSATFQRPIFLPNISAIRESVSPRIFSKGIFEYLPSRCHLRPKPQNWRCDRCVTWIEYNFHSFITTYLYNFHEFQKSNLYRSWLERRQFLTD